MMTGTRLSTLAFAAFATLSCGTTTPSSESTDPDAGADGVGPRDVVDGSDPTGDTDLPDVGADLPGGADPSDVGVSDGESDPDAGDAGDRDPFESDVPEGDTGAGDGACAVCTGDASCGAGRCVDLLDGRFCLDPCAGGVCEEGFSCARVDAGEPVCAPTAAVCGCFDEDGDGASMGTRCGPTDCAPADPLVSPLATEVCNERDDDCDGFADDGIDLQSDPDHCGACGRSCALAGATSLCVRGACTLGTCAEGFADCNGAPEDGCERPSSALNVCGGCGPLVGTPGAACGVCGSGALACVGAERIVCVGDAGASARNVCGGCSPLPERVGATCGRCEAGRIACDGTDGTECALPVDVDAYTECGSVCCAPGDLCLGALCVTPSGCVTGGDCPSDSYCLPDLGACVPYGTPPRGDYDEACTQLVTVAKFSPQIQCVWEGPPAGDAHPAWQHVLSTPMVADFDFDGAPDRVRPSIVFTSDDGSDGSSELPTGVIRIIDGRTCAQQYSLDMQLTSHSSPPAIGDLDNDGTPEVVAFMGGGGLVAFRLDRLAGSWSVYWRSTRPDGAAYTPTGAGWGGPGIHDLDDDGYPEVLRGGIVVDGRTGVLIDASLGNLAAGSAPANMSAAMDVDADGRVEIVSGNNVWEWSSPTSRWEAEAWFVWTPANQIGFVAVADLGDVPLRTLALDPAPEVVVVESGLVRAQTLEGTIFFAATAIPGGGAGGPPTIADFDGDGRAEFAAAGRGSYTVFDPDCRPGLRGGACASGRTDGILWTRTAQDYSSSQTGSSVFDFEADGRAEAIYADECFVRVYDGVSGDVIFSQFRSSCTWNENPVVADADGDFNAELIVPSNLNCGALDLGVACSGLEAGGVDPQFNGVRCSTSADCVSGVCDAGLCRCTATSQCCAGDCAVFGWACAPPWAGTAGSGNTCRATHPRGARGVRVYSDALDQWVASRPIWNQHAYFVTNVYDDATIPATSAAEANWEVPGLNNYRQNVQGGLEASATPDLTVRTRSSDPIYCDPTSRLVEIVATVCNRGTQPVDDGLSVDFFDGDPLDGGVQVCRDRTRDVLAPGACTDVACVWTDAPIEAPGVDLWIVPDAAAEVRECNEGNNLTVLSGVYCAY